MDDGSVVGVAASINLIQSKDLIEFDRFSGFHWHNTLQPSTFVITHFDIMLFRSTRCQQTADIINTHHIPFCSHK